MTYAVVKVDNEPLIHMADWDDPCLIAQSSAGNAILRCICSGDLIDTSIAAE